MTWRHVLACGRWHHRSYSKLNVAYFALKLICSDFWAKRINSKNGYLAPLSKGGNTASLAFKSRLSFHWNTRDIYRSRFAGETRAINVTCIPMEKVRRDLNASDAVFLLLDNH